MLSDMDIHISMLEKPNAWVTCLVERQRNEVKWTRMFDNLLPWKIDLNRSNTWETLAYKGPQALCQKGFNSIARHRGYRCPRNIKCVPCVRLNFRVVSMLRKTIPDKALSDTDCCSVGAPVPNNVYTIHRVEMFMTQVHCAQLAPDISLALNPR